MTLLVAIKQLYKTMCSIYEKSREEQHAMLNHPRILEYLFHRPLIKNNNNTESYPILLTSVESQEIQSLFITLMDYNEGYYKMYRQYSKLKNDPKVNSQSINNLDKNLPLCDLSLSLNMQLITAILDKLNIDHVINWSFNYSEDHVNSTKIKPYSFDIDGDIRVDFFGCMFIKTKSILTKKMIMFAIEYDHMQKKITDRDHLKQYFLRKMNIHLLRLNNNCNMKAVIKKFLQKIRQCDNYIIINGLAQRTINLDSVCIDSKSTAKQIIDSFYSNYEYNHCIYLKYHDKYKKLDLDNDDIEINTDQIIDEDDAPGAVMPVSDAFFKKFTGR